MRQGWDKCKSQYGKLFWITKTSTPFGFLKAEVCYDAGYYITLNGRLLKFINPNCSKYKTKKIAIKHRMIECEKEVIKLSQILHDYATPIPD